VKDNKIQNVKNKNVYKKKGRKKKYFVSMEKND